MGSWDWIWASVVLLTKVVATVALAVVIIILIVKAVGAINDARRPTP